MSDDVLYLHMKEPCVTVLGPGKRFAVWTQGCNRRCPGCTAPEAWDMQAGEKIAVDALAMEITLSGADGLTISGGEPFLQPAALAKMIDLIRRKREMGVIVYTGFTLEQLREMPQAQPLLERIDLLIDGPYVREQDDGLSLRGSSNQRVIPLTERYLKDLDHYGQPGRRVEIFRHGATTHRAGVADHQKQIQAARDGREGLNGETGAVRNQRLAPKPRRGESFAALMEQALKKKGE